MFILLTFVFITFFHVRAHRPTHPLASERREAWEKSICDRPLILCYCKIDSLRKDVAARLPVWGFQAMTKLLFLEV